MTVSSSQIVKASTRLINVQALAVACDRHRLPFYLGCTILEMETAGRNIFGHDRGGALADPDGKNIEVTEARFKKFLDLIRSGHTSNGVGPMQITFPGFFPQMEQQQLKAWVPADNIMFGVSILAKTWTATQSVRKTAKAYNGGDSYAATAVERAKTWRQRVGDTDTIHSIATKDPAVQHSSTFHSDFMSFGAGGTHGGGAVTPVDATILRAVQGATWGDILLSQGGLSGSEPKSAKTHLGLGVWDIAIDGRSKAEVWRLARRLLRSGVVAFPRGFGDGMTPKHIHCVSQESLAHAHAEAQEQLNSGRFGYLHTVGGKRGAGLAGSPDSRYIGPGTTPDRWSDSPYNPANITADTNTYFVDVAPGTTLLGLNVDRKVKFNRPPGFKLVAARQIRRWGRQNVVTKSGTYYALEFLNKTDPLAGSAPG